MFLNWRSDIYKIKSIKSQFKNDTTQGTSREVGDFIGGELVLGTW